MKKFLLLALSLMLCFSLVACGGDAPADDTTPDDLDGADVATDDVASESDLAYIQDKGTMIVGYTMYEPMNFEDENGELTGFDTELTKLVAEKLGVTPEFQLINWDTKEIELEGKTIDVIWNGFTLNEERMANMACTDPYVKNAQVVVVKNGFEYTDLTSLAGKTVVAEIGSAGETQIIGESADPALAEVSYIGKSTQVDSILEVQAGTADAAIVDLTLAMSMTGEGTDFAEITMVDELAEEYYGVAFRKGSDVPAEVNAIFDELMADGTMTALAEKYGLVLAE